MKIKRGDTLSFLVKREDELGQPIIGGTIKSHIRNSLDKKIAEFVIAPTLNDGEYEFLVSANITKTFPVGTLFFDIETIDDGVTTSSDTEELIVEKDYTYGY
jgi:hypothetical protein